ncbi:hypothetical protein OCU04_003953 [Sclerotinia nivalis]|uniref:SAP domain-containing protein n=1 Tax=Sclerotinia nivalis TaxID=352851 RepID=A0A9X0ATX2_9HELO|nr:hypothetical protein OCU04_003953 [Sclerotinia nivalis]
MSQSGFFDDMASGMEFFSYDNIDLSSFQYDGDVGIPLYDEVPPKSPPLSPTPSREETPEFLRSVLEGTEFSELRPRSEKERAQNGAKPSSEKPSEDFQKLDSEKPSEESQKLDSERQFDGKANNTNEPSVSMTSDPPQDVNNATTASDTPENTAENITDDIDNDSLFGDFEDSGLGIDDDGFDTAFDAGDCKSVKNKNNVLTPIATVLEPNRLHLPEPPRVNTSQQRLHLPDHPGDNPAKDNNGTRLHLPSTPSADIQQAAVNTFVQQQNNVGQENSTAPLKPRNARSGRRQGGAGTSGKMSRPQSHDRARATGPTTKLSGPPPSVFQPLELDSSSDEGKSSKSRRASHFTWAFAGHVDFGKPGPGNKYRRNNSAQDPIMVGDDSKTVEKTNEEVNNRQSQDVDRPVTKVPGVIDLTSENGDGSPVESDKDNHIGEVDGKNHSEDFADGQSSAQDYESFPTPAQNHLAPTNNPIRQTPEVQPVLPYHPQVPANAQFPAPQNQAPHQPQLREHSMFETPSGFIHSPHPSYPNIGRRYFQNNGIFSNSPLNYSSPYGQHIQQTPEVHPLRSSYPEVENNLSFPNSNDGLPRFPVFQEAHGLQHLPMDQAASFPHHGHLSQVNDQYDDGLSDGASDSEEESSVSGTRDIRNNGRNAQASPRRNKPRPCESRAEYGYHRPWMRYDEYKYLFPLAEPRLCFENAIAKRREEDAVLIAKGEAIPPRNPIIRHIKISHERLNALNQLRLSNGEEPFKPKLSGVKDQSAFLEAKRRRIEEEQEEYSGYEGQETGPDAKRPRLAPAPIQPAAPAIDNPMMGQQDPNAMMKRQRYYMAYRVPQLKDKCKALGLRTQGLKGVLVQRLVDHEANSRPVAANNGQQMNQAQGGWGAGQGRPMPDVGPMNGMQAPPVAMNYGRQQHQGQGGRGVRQDQPLPYAGPVHGMGPSYNYQQNPSTMQYAPATSYRAPGTGSIMYGNTSQPPWNGGRGGSLNNYYPQLTHGASAGQESMNAGLGGYGGFQQPMNGGSNGYTHGSFQQPYSAGHQGNASGSPQYSTQGFAGGYVASFPEGSMHDPPCGTSRGSMRQPSSGNGNGNGNVNMAMGMAFDHMSSMNPDQNNINQTMSNSLGSNSMNWQADGQMGTGDMNWNQQFYQRPSHGGPQESSQGLSHGPSEQFQSLGFDEPPRNPFNRDRFSPPPSS